MNNLNAAAITRALSIETSIVSIHDAMDIVNNMDAVERIEHASGTIYTGRSHVVIVPMIGDSILIKPIVSQ